MYLGPPPQQLTPEVWTELPAELHIAPTPERHNFLEGPSFDRDGNLIVGSFADSRVAKFDIKTGASIPFVAPGAGGHLLPGTGGKPFRRRGQRLHHRGIAQRGYRFRHLL